jgi:hypothetical protein
MGLFWTYRKFGGICHICGYQTRSGYKFKRHIKGEYKTFFSVPVKIEAFVLSQRRRIQLYYKEQPLVNNFMESAGVSEDLADATFCWFCRVRLENQNTEVVCAGCKAVLDTERVKEYTVWVDGKEYVNDLIKGVIIKLIKGVKLADGRNEGKEDSTSYLDIRPFQLRKQFRIDDFSED